MKIKASLITPTSVSVLFEDNSNALIKESNVAYTQFRDAVKAKDWDKAYLIAFPSKHISAQLSSATNGEVTVVNNVCIYKGQPLNNTVTRRIVQLLLDGCDITPM